LSTTFPDQTLGNRSLTFDQLTIIVQQDDH